MTPCTRRWKKPVFFKKLNKTRVAEQKLQRKKTSKKEELQYNHECNRIQPEIILSPPKYKNPRSLSLQGFHRLIGLHVLVSLPWVHLGAEHIPFDFFGFDKVLHGMLSDRFD